MNNESEKKLIVCRDRGKTKKLKTIPVKPQSVPENKKQLFAEEYYKMYY